MKSIVFYNQRSEGLKFKLNNLSDYIVKDIIKEIIGRCDHMLKYKLFIENCNMKNYLLIMLNLFLRQCMMKYLRNMQEKQFISVVFAKFM